MSSTLNATAAELIGNTLEASKHDAQDSRSALSPDAQLALASFGWGDVLDYEAYTSAVPGARYIRREALAELAEAGLIRHVQSGPYVRLTDAGRRALFPAEG